MSSDSEDDVGLDDEFMVELGFVCDKASSLDSKPLHGEPDWTKWDGGQIGGRPSWLCPSLVGIPSSRQLQCENCDNVLSFLLQIYCPLDEEVDAFHRSFRQGDGKAFRLQLPKDNVFYAAEPGAMQLKTIENKGDEVRQKMIQKGSMWVFPKQDLEIDHEPDCREAANECVAAEKVTKNQEEDSTDLDITQQEVNEALGHTKDQDEQYVRFLTRVAIAKDQVLRYSRWKNEAVLWVHSEGMQMDDVPPCERCGGERKFEFQVLPQLLNFLSVDLKSCLGDIASRTCEWGTLAVYTCAKSCPLETQCAQEFLHYQPAYAGTR
ncbi:hypothetical protein KXD40_007027 [Peronospora effusa]|uniref:Programmed cell death protein 2 C-terminal domain-containing protein n=1 Tax=Peronospora effusa TaxID=542832 RepID=A0A3R7Y505_9STRA|nr:hypothetical protein DD237_007909 [Peronospora effusa]UIZ24875.1 hypothetical protein KXD40_007027 [Peronospora effusa]